MISFSLCHVGFFKLLLKVQHLLLKACTHFLWQDFLSDREHPSPSHSAGSAPGTDNRSNNPTAFVDQ